LTKRINFDNFQARLMMELMEAILTRRSIRHFKPNPVPEDLVKKLLQAAMQAPSAANAQPWHFVVIDDRFLLEQVTTFHPASGCLHLAPLAILVCGDDQLEKRPDRYILDCSAATENILLAAHGLGLGAVWLGIHPDNLRIENISRMLNLPSNVHPLSLVAVGYPDRAAQPADRFKPERVHQNQW
jgi:nitroreductase